tara:strand:+ start:1604 stop:1834 length:231 start_codon:yes stop_codon:yes gene_type:complete
MEVFYIDILGWLGFLLILVGYYLNAQKQIICFPIWAIGNIIYIIYGFILNAFPIMAMSIFVLGMNVYGYKNWVRDP